MGVIFDSSISCTHLQVLWILLPNLPLRLHCLPLVGANIASHLGHHRYQMSGKPCSSLFYCIRHTAPRANFQNQTWHHLASIPDASHCSSDQSQVLSLTLHTWVPACLCSPGTPFMPTSHVPILDLFSPPRSPLFLPTLGGCSLRPLSN